MLDVSSHDLMESWFPSLAGRKNLGAFIWAHNDFLCTTPAGKRSVLDDKLLLSGALTVSGVRTPQTLLAVIDGRFRSPLHGELSEDEVIRLLKGKAAFIKARTGYGGEGAFRLHADGSVVSADGSPFKKGLRRLLGRISKADYLIQELVVQDEVFSAVAPASVNTVRCITLRGRDGEIGIAGATWRVGNGKAVVDNASGGGMFCGIDPENVNILGPAQDLSGSIFEAHPASGFAFEGTTISGFRDIFDAAKTAHRVLDTSMTIGWDIAMTPDGPTIIEGNGRWMPELHVLVDDQFERRAWDLFVNDHSIAGTGFPALDHPARSDDLISATLSIHGNVQDVGFRKWISRYATERGVKTHARNMGDGSVRVRLTGQRWRVEFVTLECHRGSRAAQVDRVDVIALKQLR